MHPDWEYRLWTDAELPHMRNRHAFDISEAWHQKADILRYEVLWQYGGVYIDADSLALKPLDPLLEGTEMFAGYEGSPERPELIANGVIGCSPGHSAMDQLLNEIDVEGEADTWEMVGPLFFTRMIAEHRMPVRLYPSHFFYPFHHTDPRELYRSVSRHDPRLSGSYLLQYWGTTFHLYGERLAFRLMRRLHHELRKLGLTR
jgi:mannosyltransferase OCH1-like enzyme